MKRKESPGVTAFAIVGGLTFVGVILYCVLVANHVFFDPVKEIGSEGYHFNVQLYGFKPKDLSYSAEILDAHFSKYKKALMNAYDGSSKLIQIRMIDLFNYEKDKDLESSVLKTIAQPYYYTPNQEYFLLIHDALDYLSWINNPDDDSAVFELLKGAVSIMPQDDEKAILYEKREVISVVWDYLATRGNDELIDNSIGVLQTYKDNLKRLSNADPALVYDCQRLSNYADIFIYSKTAAQCVEYLNNTALSTDSRYSIDYNPGKVIVLQDDQLSTYVFNSLSENIRSPADFEQIQTIFCIKQLEGRPGGNYCGEQAIVYGSLISVIDKSHNALIATITVKPKLPSSIMRGSSVEVSEEELILALKRYLASLKRIN